MVILLTNDDGYNAEGITRLRKLLEKHARVIIVAPKEAMSAKSCSITIGETLHFIKVAEDTYYVDGTPADCVALAMSQIQEHIDLVISGCNKGLNVSYDSIYSGTIGACLEALSYGLKAVAISSPFDTFETLEKGFDMMWEFITKNDLISNEYILNINFPHEGPEGIQIAQEYYRHDKNYFTYESGGYYAYRHMDNNNDLPHDADCYLVKNKIISVVPLQRTYYSEIFYKKLKDKNK